MAESKTDKLKSLSIDRTQNDAGGGASTAVVLAAVAATAIVAGGAGWWLGAQSGPGASSNTEIAASPPPPPSSSSSTATPSTAGASTASADTGAESSGSDVRPTRPVAGALIASGYVVARRQATASSEITGRLIEVDAEEGDIVEAGQVLGRLDSSRAEIDRNLAKARAEAAKATADALRAELAEANRVLARTQKLSDSEFASTASLQTARSRVTSIAASLRSAEAQAKVAELDVAQADDYLERHLVRAPFSGVIIAKNAQAGEIVSPVSAGGGFTRTGVATVVDMASLEIEVDVNEGRIERVRAGMKAEAVLDAYPNWAIPAKVIAIIPTANRDRATIQVRIGFEAVDPRILPDMAAKVTFVDEAAALDAPARAG